MAADGETGHEKVAPALQSRVGWQQPPCPDGDRGQRAGKQHSFMKDSPRLGVWKRWDTGKLETPAQPDAYISDVSSPGKERTMGCS